MWTPLGAKGAESHFLQKMPYFPEPTLRPISGAEWSQSGAKFPDTAPQTVREAELPQNQSTLHFRRVNLPVRQGVNDAATW